MIIVGYSQTHSQELPNGNYVVVGAYLKGDEKYLTSFMESLKLKGQTPVAGFQTQTGFYYVYLETYSNLKDALIKMESTRLMAGLDKTWVHVIKTGAEVIPETTPVSAQSNSTPVKENLEQPSQVSSDKNNPEELTQVKPIDVPETPTQIIESKSPEMASTIGTLADTEVILSIYDAQKNKIVQGEIELVDTERARLMAKIKGNEKVKLPDPKSKSGQLSLICNVFGYRRAQQEISYPNPKPEEAEKVGNTYVVKFDMVRYQRGDIQTLYKVFFYNDASVMLVESKYELNCLLDMMNDNPNCEITLHGHTNGNAHGKIITLGKSKDFFTLNKENTNIENGSAKELSNQRALTIREWLITNGVAPNRVTVKPWGGKRMLHDKNGINAKKNIRVEVEVVKD